MTCTHCGFCCTHRVLLSKFDIFRILLTGNFPFEFLDSDGWDRKYIKLIKGDCFFLKREGSYTSCSIYKFRPKICRDFPECHK